jgi:hypothetical protein
MTVGKQHQIGKLKAKVAGGKDDDVLLTTGDVMIIGVGGDAKLISAKAMGIENDSHLVVRSKAKKGNKSYSAAEALIARSRVENDPSAADVDFDTTLKVMSGTGEEVVRVLDRTPNARFVAVRIENQDEEQATAAANVFARVAEFLPQLIETRQEETLKKFVDTLLPSVTPSAAARAQAQMLIAARSSILQSGDFITPKEVSKLAGYSDTNPSVYPNKWKRSGKIFAIQSEGKDYFPFYALDPNNKYQPREEVADVLRIFGESKDSWGIALWFASLNSFLDDERPQDTLAIDPSRVAAAAEDEMAGIQHG